MRERETCRLCTGMKHPKHPHAIAQYSVTLTGHRHSLPLCSPCLTREHVAGNVSRYDVLTTGPPAISRHLADLLVVLVVAEAAIIILLLLIYA